MTARATPSILGRFTLFVAGLAVSTPDTHGPLQGLLARAGLTADALAAPGARVPLSAHYRVLEAALEHTADPYWGLVLGAAFPPDAGGVLGFLGACSRTVHEAFSLICRHQRLFSDEHFAYQPDDDGGWLVFQPWGLPRPAHRVIGLAALADMTRGARYLVDEPLGEEASAVAPSLAELPLPEPDDPELRSRLETALGGARLRFGRDRWALRFPQEVLERALPRRDDALRAFLSQQAVAAEAALPALAEPPLERRLRALLEERLPHGPPRLKEVAARLRMSPRTLQRRLADRGTSLGQVGDAVRSQQACRWLREGRAPGEVAFLLGFSAPSAFSRAFRRWHGQTVSDWLEGDQSA